ncbi:MAG: Abi family protein [Burkholderiales bacterium]|nr:Abi family protein [Burkholderiales bacterium]
MTDIHEMNDLFEQRNIYLTPPASVDDQIKILRSRGMLVDDYAYAKDFLEEVYFHRFLSYSVPFLANGDSRRYQLNTKFADVVKVYEFDSQLRSLLLDAIEKIEISVRTQFTNLSWKYGSHFYLNHKLFRDHRQLNDSIERIQFQIKSGHDLLVSEYYHRYNDPAMPPVWIAVELTTIGQLTKLFMNLKHAEDKEAVAQRYQIHYSVLQAIMDNLTLIRNYSAHHTRIWNRHFNFECSLDNQHQLISHALCDGSRMYSVLVLITYILKTLGVEQPFYKRLIGLISIYNINVDLMGFPSDWQDNFSILLHGKK